MAFQCLKYVFSRTYQTNVYIQFIQQTKIPQIITSLLHVNMYKYYQILVYILHFLVFVLTLSVGNIFHLPYQSPARPEVSCSVHAKSCCQEHVDLVRGGSEEIEGSQKLIG